MTIRIDFEPDETLYPFESAYFDSSVGRVHYIDEGEGRPALFLHGNPTWSFLYRDIVRQLRGDFRCIAVDYPGFGLSDRPGTYDYTAREHAAVVGELVESLGLEDAILMGQDWGGPIGMSVATEQPERFSGFCMGNTWFWPLERRLNKLFSWVMASGPMEWLVLERNFFVERFLPLGTAQPLSHDVMNHYRAVQPRREARLGVAEFPRQLTAAGDWLASLAEDVDEELADRPLLMTWGMNDPAFAPSKFSPRWKETFDDWSFVPLEDAAHFIQEDAPERVAEAIRRQFGPGD